jgi:hypothetical protein
MEPFEGSVKYLGFHKVSYGTFWSFGRAQKVSYFPYETILGSVECIGFFKVSYRIFLGSVSCRGFSKVSYGLFEGSVEWKRFCFLCTELLRVLLKKKGFVFSVRNYFRFGRLHRVFLRIRMEPFQGSVEERFLYFPYGTFLDSAKYFESH